MACKINLSDYAVKDVVKLEQEVNKEGSIIIDTVDKSQLLSHITDSYAGTLVTKRGHIVTANSLQALNVDRSDCLQYLSNLVPNWPKFPVDHSSVERAGKCMGKDAKDVLKLKQSDSHFDLFHKAIIAFNTWLSRTYEAGSWNVKEKVTKLKTVKDNTSNKGKGNDGTVEKFPSESLDVGNTGVAVESPNKGQVERLSELQIMSQFLEMVNGCEAIQSENKELANELCKLIATDIAPDSVAALQEAATASLR